ncbi:FAD-binding oxidoreductase [Nocardioides sp. Kera G14]|uniref:FAD-binding oxidoreductase n=1 Tax=Nocardioides sp. Kera G14 TaxID=2884264 RepID=UPI001D1058DF|nr:FAD-linked oxidase C-terminal domain-containing protein [Nocardioides sp. Kera G14]UDY23030.1 FAD-binding protein [Nocardioides sp. Kera G14]
MSLPEGFLSALDAAVEDVSTDPVALAAAALDRSGVVPESPPSVLVRPVTVDEVRETLRLASHYVVPVVPRGGGSGVAGAAVAGPGQVVLDVSGLDQIKEIDAVDQIAIVGPGVVTATLEAAAGRVGLRYAPDPASAAISTIGGNIATNAGGLRCVKYGVTRDAVLGLDVVLADGTLLSTGRQTLKGVAGLDLTSLFVGSEGTLGVVVGATLRLRPLPEQTLTVAAAFSDVEAAARACAAVAAARREPSMLELLDERTLRVVDRAQGTTYSQRGGALVIAQADGPAAGLEITAIAEVLGKEATWVEQGVDEESSARLVEARRLALPSIEAFGSVLIEDICVPRSRLAEAFRRVAEIGDRHGVRIYSFAHAGDGNLHPLVGYPRGPVPAGVVAAGDEIFGLALELGGTVTGEHGVGLLKRDWLAREIGPEALAVHRTLKAALDPVGILNPGKGY